MANDNKVQMERLVEKLRARGFEVVKHDGHFNVKRPDGSRLTTLPGTPSDRRSIDNSYAELRRLGIDVRKSDKKKKGSIDDFALQRIRERVRTALARGMTRAELTRVCQHVAHKKRISPFGSTGSGELLIKRVVEGQGRITKQNHNLLAAALNVLESADDKSLAKHINDANEYCGKHSRHVQPPAPKSKVEVTAAVEKLVEEAFIPIAVEETETTEVVHVHALELRIPAAERAWIRELILAVLENRSPDGQ